MNSICQIKEGNKITHGWCSFQDVDEDTNIAQLVYSACFLICSCIIIRNLHMVQKYRDRKHSRVSVGDSQIIVSKILSAWALCMIIRVSINIGIYYVYIKQDKDPEQNDPEKWSPIVILSVIMTFIILMCTFFINLLIWFVAYQSLKVLLVCVYKSSLATFSIKKKIKIWIKILNFFRIYFIKVRNILILIGIIEFPLFYFANNIFDCKFQLINYYAVSGETGIILFFYIFVLYVACFIKYHGLVTLQFKKLTVISCSFILLLMVIIFRVFLNIIYNILYSSNSSNGSQYSKNENNWYTLTIMIISIYVMHLLPSIIVIYIYRVKIEDRDQDRKWSDIFEVQSTFDNIKNRFYQESFIQNARISQSQFNQFNE